MCPLALYSLSDGTLVAGMHKSFLLRVVVTEMACQIRRVATFRRDFSLAFPADRLVIFDEFAIRTLAVSEMDPGVGPSSF